MSGLSLSLLSTASEPVVSTLRGLGGRVVLLTVSAILAGCGEVVCYPDGTTLAGGVAADLPTSSDLSSATSLRHYGLDAVLRLQTTEEAEGGGTWRLVDYAGLVASAEATGTLTAYLSAIASVDPSNLATREERLAYWLNAYNAWVLYGVAAKYAQDPAYDVESDEWLLFSTPFVEVAGLTLSPNDIEHGILRAWEDQPYADEAVAERAREWSAELWGGDAPDARLHMGLNCASWSCPNVPPGAFQGARLDAQLDALAVAFVDNTEKGAGPDGVSTLFNWFGADFAATFGSVDEFLATYRTGGLDDVDTATFLPYDWSLNEASAFDASDATGGVAW